MDLLGALLFGVMYSTEIGQNITQTVAGEKVDISLNTLKVIETTGLVLFIGAVGLIAGPNFIRGSKKNFKYYALIGLVVTAVGVLATVICYFVGRGSAGNQQEFLAAITGVMSGALTSAAAMSSTQTAVATVASGSASTLSVADAEAIVAVGYGVAYMFGVIGTVLFVQVIPRMTKANMEEEREKIRLTEKSEDVARKKLFEVEPMGLCVVAFVVVIGILLGSFKVPLTPSGYSGATFSLTATGGVLLVALVVGHFGHIGPIEASPSQNTLKSVRELGLVLFLFGSGVAGGMKLVQYFKLIYFFYGVIITVAPMVVAYLLPVREARPEDEPAEQPRLHCRRHDVHARARRADQRGRDRRRGLRLCGYVSRGPDQLGHLLPVPDTAPVIARWLCPPLGDARMRHVERRTSHEHR